GIGPFRELGEIKEKARNMIRIFVVDDHPIIRKALRSLLENESIFTFAAKLRQHRRHSRAYLKPIPISYWSTSHFPNWVALNSYVSYVFATRGSQRLSFPVIGTGLSSRH